MSLCNLSPSPPPPGPPSPSYYPGCEDELVPDDNGDVEVEEPRNRNKKRRRTVPVVALRRAGHNESERLETNQVLLETSARVDDAISELVACARTLSGPSGGDDPARRDAIERIRGSILPVLYIASRALFDTGMSFAPFGGTKGIHGRAEAERKKRVVDRRSEKSPALQMMDAFVGESIVDVPEDIAHFPLAVAAPPRPVAAPPKKAARSTRDADTETISILRPRNGMSYTRSEALRVCKMYKKNSRERGMAIRAMRHMKFTPASAKVISALCQDDEAGLPIIGEGWRQRGRPPARPNPDEEVVTAAEQLGRPRAEDLIEVTMPKQPRRKAIELKAASIPPASSRNEQEVASLSASNAEDALTPGPRLLLTLREGKAPVSDKPPASRASPKRKRKAPDYDKIISFPLPVPREGNVYTRSEAVAVITQYPRGSKQRPLAIHAMRHRGYVPASERTIREMVAKADKGLPIFDTAWGSKGRPPLLSNGEIDVIAERLRRDNRRVYRPEDTRELLANAVREKIVREGRNPDEVAVKLDKSTLTNYEALLKSKLGSMFWMLE